MSDESNTSPLGKTAHYDPNSMEITIYVDGRHPKDIMRSFSHELVHHKQNENGMFNNLQGESGDEYAQTNPHLRKMEKEAYLKGNMCFRDWEDGYKSSNPNILNERRIYKMSIKDWKDKELNSLLNEKWGFSMNLNKLNENKNKKGKYDDGDNKDEKCDYVDCGYKEEETIDELKIHDGGLGNTPEKETNAAKEQSDKNHAHMQNQRGNKKEIDNKKTQTMQEGVKDLSQGQIQSLLKIFQDMGGSLPKGKDIADFARDIKNHENKEKKDKDPKEEKLREAVRKIIKSKLKRK